MLGLHKTDLLLGLHKTNLIYMLGLHNTDLIYSMLEINHEFDFQHANIIPNF
jgi:hypothetical protein